MKTVHFATTNKGKVDSLRSVLSPHGIEVIHENVFLDEPRTDDLQLIARQKVTAAFDLLHKPVVAQDAGFYIHSLNGFPKAFVNFTLETIGVDGILKLVEGKSRECEFRNCLAYLDADLEEPVLFTSTTTGFLAESARGEIPANAWSSLWLIFTPTGKTQTLAEMSQADYQAWRATVHQNSYGSKFAKWLAAEAEGTRG